MTMDQVAKTIEDITQVLNNVCTGVSVEQDCTFKSCNECKAKALYNAGYRKQEWISVEDRLPQEDTRVLVAIAYGRSYTDVDTDRMLKGKWVRWGKDVTHWQPLPQHPK